MKIPRVIRGLAKKRAELVAELAHAEGRADYCRAGIAAIDAVLPLWDVEPPVYKRRYKSKPTILPKLVRKIVIALREAPEPLMTRQIVDAVSVGLDLDVPKRLELTRLVIQRLRDPAERGAREACRKRGQMQAMGACPVRPRLTGRGMRLGRKDGRSGPRRLRRGYGGIEKP
jgi:hypothetical protein